MKTLYTPVFYSSPQPASSGGSSSSSSSASSQAPIYLDRLSRIHIGLAQMVQEVPASRPSSPAADTRVEKLKGKVHAAYVAAKGDPSEGKWGHLASALRMVCVQGGYRWHVVSTASCTEDGSDQGVVGVLADTEAEWFAWEKETKLKRKVNSWNQKVIADDSSRPPKPVLDESEGTRVDTISRAVPEVLQPRQRKVHDLKDPSRLGFPVMKHTSVNLNGKAKKSQIGNGQQKPQGDSVISAEAGPSTPRPVLNADDAVHPFESDFVPPLLGISDITSMSFLPPSFPSSELFASTPYVQTARRTKPPPILPQSPVPPAPVSPAYPPPQTPIFMNVSSSLPVLSSSPVHDARKSEKRPRPLTPPYAPNDEGHVLKKARTMPVDVPMTYELHSSNNPIPATTLPRPTPPSPPSDRVVRSHEPPVTPKHTGQLPTLTELLASSKKSKSSLVKTHTPFERGKDIVSVLDRSNPHNEEKRERPIPTRLTPIPSIGDERSPTKSLSSLAGSDSSDSRPGSPTTSQAPPNGFGGNNLAFTQGNDSFAPIYESTQARAGGVGVNTVDLSQEIEKRNGGFFGMYNSQFDVEGQVDKVSEFLEKDVDLFDGWLRDVSGEEEEDGS